MQDPEHVRSLFSAIARRYDLANQILSGGLHRGWRRRATALVASWHPADVLDIATGSGDLALSIARACPEAKVTGTDFCEPMLRRAREKGLERTVLADALDLPFPAGSFDAATVAFGLRNMASWPGALREMARVLRPGGRLLVLDFSVPANPLVRGLYRFYLHRILPLLAAMVTRQKSAYEYLGASIEKFPSREKMTALIEECGFAAAEYRTLCWGIVTLYTASKTRL